VRKRNEEGILVEAGLCLETEYTEFCSIQLNVIVTSAETNTLKVLKTEQFYFIPQEKKKEAISVRCLLYGLIFLNSIQNQR
jgi:hypothetical protein